MFPVLNKTITTTYSEYKNGAINDKSLLIKETQTVKTFLDRFCLELSRALTVL